MDQNPNYPPIIFTTHTSAHRQGEVPLIFTQVGRVSFYSSQGVLVRVICGETNLFLDSATVHTLFRGEKIGQQVGLSALKFHLLRLLGEESLKVIEPFVSKALGQDDE